MSKRANPVTIGLFVVSACILLIGALAFLGAAKLMRENPRFVVYFDESVNGLDVGAWVKFKGVPVGRVADIRIRTRNQMPESDAIPVIIELYDQHIVNDLGAPDDVSNAETVAQNVRLGLRARLNTESLITGLLFVELDFVENAPEAIYHQDEPELVEIPTIPSQLQEIARNATVAIARIGDIDFAELGRNLNRLLYIANTRIEELNTAELSARLNRVLGEIETIMDADRIVATIDNLNEAVVSVRSVSENFNSALPSLMEEADTAVSSLTTTLATATRTLDTVNNAISPDSKLQREILGVLQDAQSALEAMKDLATFLENNPKALLTGRSD